MTSEEDYSKQVFYFDVDNTLYPQSSGIGELMAERIKMYCITRMNMSEVEAKTTSAKYSLDYGLAIRGLLKHHTICPNDYDAFVDGGLPLDDILKPDPAVRSMIQRLKTRKWVFTNAGIQHAKRTLRLLNLIDLFEGITYCDYSLIDFPCKPEAAAYKKAMKEASIDDPKACYLIDDSFNNTKKAAEAGWNAIHIVEFEKDEPKVKASPFLVHKLLELETLFPHLFVK